MTGQQKKDAGGALWACLLTHPPPEFIWRRGPAFCRTNPPPHEEPELVLPAGGCLGSLWPWRGFPPAWPQGSLESLGGTSGFRSRYASRAGIPAEVAPAFSGPKLEFFVTLPEFDSAGPGQGPDSSHDSRVLWRLHRHATCHVMPWKLFPLGGTGLQFLTPLAHPKGWASLEARPPAGLTPSPLEPPLLICCGHVPLTQGGEGENLPENTAKLSPAQKFAVSVCEAAVPAVSQQDQLLSWEINGHGHVNLGSRAGRDIKSANCLKRKVRER